MRQKVIGLIILLFVCVAGFWGIAGAQEFRSGNTSSVESGETIDTTLWISGRTINVAGTVNGDVFCAGQHVTVSGTVQGDLLCAAQTITVSGKVAGSIRAAAMTLTVNGNVGRNVSVLSQNFNQGPNSTIDGDVTSAGGDAVLTGTVGRDAAISASAIRLDGRIGRNVQATTGSLTLGDRAAIAGDLSYTSRSDAKIASGASVEGEVTKSTPQPKPSTGDRFGKTLRMILYTGAAALLLSLILVLLFPQAIHAITAIGLTSFWKALLVGLVAIIVVPVIAVVAMLTIIGIPLGLVVLGTWLVVQVLAGVVAAYLLGRLIWRKQRNPALIMLLGTVALVILPHIPIVGFLVWLAASLVGNGMLLLALWRSRPKANYNLDPRPGR